MENISTPTPRTPAQAAIALFGGLTAVSRATGWPVSTIQYWNESGTIPHWRVRPLADAARRLGITLPAGLTG